MPKQLSEAAAWRKLAEWCGEPIEEPRRRQFLCHILHPALYEPFGWYDHPPKDWPLDVMRFRIKHHADDFEDTLDQDDGGPFPGNNARVIFCLLMALECEEEGLG